MICNATPAPTLYRYTPRHATPRHAMQRKAILDDSKIAGSRGNLRREPDSCRGAVDKTGLALLFHSQSGMLLKCTPCPNHSHAHAICQCACPLGVADLSSRPPALCRQLRSPWFVPLPCLFWLYAFHIPQLTAWWPCIARAYLSSYRHQLFVQVLGCLRHTLNRSLVAHIRFCEALQDRYAVVINSLYS
jgi:hypothetical protein